MNPESCSSFTSIVSAKSCALAFWSKKYNREKKSSKNNLDGKSCKLVLVNTFNDEILLGPKFKIDGLYIMSNKGDKWANSAEISV